MNSYPVIPPGQYGQVVSSVTVPFQIGFGLEWTEATSFDDKFFLKDHKEPIKLFSIQVSQTPKYIQGIAFKYKAADGQVITTSHNMCSNELSKMWNSVTVREFLIADNDYLKSISGRHGDWIDRLELVTYNGQNQNYGGKGGSTDFKFEFPGYTFTTASGSFRSFIDRLKFQVVPLPDYFIQQLAQRQGYTSQITYPSQYTQQQAQFIGGPQQQYVPPQQQPYAPIQPYPTGQPPVPGYTPVQPYGVGPAPVQPYGTYDNQNYGQPYGGQPPVQPYGQPTEPYAPYGQQPYTPNSQPPPFYGQLGNPLLDSQHGVDQAYNYPPQ